MIRRNKFFLLIFFFIIFTTYNVNDRKKNFSFFFPIKKIIIDNSIASDLLKLKIELEFLKNTSLFFLEKKKITEVINKHEFISSIQLRKKYPNTLKIFIFEKMPVAIEIAKKKKKLFNKRR